MLHIVGDCTLGVAFLTFVVKIVFFLYLLNRQNEASYVFGDLGCCDHVSNVITPVFL